MKTMPAAISTKPEPIHSRLLFFLGAGKWACDVAVDDDDGAVAVAVVLENADARFAPWAVIGWQPLQPGPTAFV